MFLPNHSKKNQPKKINKKVKFMQSFFFLLTVNGMPG